MVFVVYPFIKHFVTWSVFCKKFSPKFGHFEANWARMANFGALGKW